ncbi:MAG: hypothetical protein KDJ76_10940 [Xanthobacteraceae bacterium]|nr:hypothetical protein [Xanthobacteraceae bacterium]
MMTGLLIAGAAGCASALMFASISSGALISLLLFYLAPLPLMVAAIGWSPNSAAIGGSVAGLCLGAIFGFPYFAAYLLTVALPAWWLGRIVMLGRPLAPEDSVPAPAAGTPIPTAMEWYPIGRLLLWIAGFAALTTIATMLTLGTDGAAIQEALRRGLTRLVTGSSDATPSADAAKVIAALTVIAPSAAAIIATTTLTLNLWLAGYVTATSGRLRRPWPTLRATTLPPMTLVALLVALAFCFSGGLAGLIAQVITAALLLVYAFVGFAVLHTITQTMRTRTLLLATIYAAVTVFGWPIVVLTALGLVDALIGIRERYLGQQPPAPPLS